MIYPYEVKFNGEYYEAGEDVPIEQEHKPEPEELPTEEIREEKPKYTKTNINMMNKAALVNLAGAVGILGAEDKSGAELKELLIKHFNL